MHGHSQRCMHWTQRAKSVNTTQSVVVKQFKYSFRTKVRMQLQSVIFTRLLAFLQCCYLAFGSPLSEQIKSRQSLTANDIKRFPFAASLGFYNDKQCRWVHLCSSVILRKDVVATAGHCLRDCLKNPGPNYQVVVGTSRTVGIDPPPDDQRFNISAISMHSEYDNVTAYFDIGLIHLEVNLTFSPEVQPIAISTAPARPGEILQVVGFGRQTNKEGDPGGSLGYVDQKVLSRNQCNEMHNGVSNIDIETHLPKSITSQLICSMGSKDEGTCVGDSGAPLVRLDPMTTSYQLVGILHGRTNGDICEDKGMKYPSLYANITLPDIKSFIDKELYPLKHQNPPHSKDAHTITQVNLLNQAKDVFDFINMNLEIPLYAILIFIGAVVLIFVTLIMLLLKARRTCNEPGNHQSYDYEAVTQDIETQEPATATPTISSKSHGDRVNLLKQ